MGEVEHEVQRVSANPVIFYEFLIDGALEEGADPEVLCAQVMDVIGINRSLTEEEIKAVRQYLVDATGITPPPRLSDK